MLAGTRATVTILRTECASPTSAVEVSGAISTVLWSDGCHSTGSKTLGPVFQAGQIFFSIKGIPARVTGVYPEFLVEMEDASDNDYNDVVCSVTVFCSFVPPSETNPLLADPVTQQALEYLWRLSSGDDPLAANRIERGGYLVARGGEIEFVEYDYDRPASACSVRPRPGQAAEIEDSGGDIVAQVHTHVLAAGKHPNPGSCTWQTGPEIEVVTDGPSPADRNRLAEAEDPGRVAVILGPGAIFVLGGPESGFELLEIPRIDTCR